MQTKHFFSNSDDLVLSALHSCTLTNPSLGIDPAHKIIFRRPELSRKQKVSIVTGGGAGHEPAFAGLVGHGLCDAAVSGTVFASPSAAQIHAAIIDCVPHEEGVLVIPMNYTGDVLNFGMAAEKSRAVGIHTEFFAMGDDVGVGRHKSGRVGRRGIAGSVLIIKMVGALAELGGNIEEILALAKLANLNLVSVGCSLEHVHIPGQSIPELESIQNDEVELGAGIHNEPGSQRVKSSLVDVVSTMLRQLLDKNDTDRAYISYDKGDSFVLLINNLGGVSPLELSGITSEVHRQLQLDYHSLKVVRVIQGTFLTSLNSLGFSISLLMIADTGLGEGRSMLNLLDAPSEAVGWSAPIATSTWQRDPVHVALKGPQSIKFQASNLKIDYDTVKKILSWGLQRVINAESDITRFDTIVGDGDCGVGLKRGAQAVQALLDQDKSLALTDDIVYIMERIVSVVEKTMDGTSGAIYAIFINALVLGLRAQSQGYSSAVPVTIDSWTGALKYAIIALTKYTPAKVGDRTMMDALLPFYEVLLTARDIHTAAAAAREGAESTKSMKACLGRAVYVGSEQEWIGQIPDPGAYGLSEFLIGLATAL